MSQSSASQCPWRECQRSYDELRELLALRFRRNMLIGLNRHRPNAVSQYHIGLLLMHHSHPSASVDHPFGVQLRYCQFLDDAVVQSHP